MPQVRFYHLQKQTLDQALPLILQKALGQEKRVLVKMATDKSITAMSKILWTFRPESFLAHGAAKDEFAADQPILLTTEDDNLNDAGILILTEGATCDDLDAYDLCCEMFDGRDDAAVQAARQRWKSYKDKGYDLTYWMQDDQGRWNEKAA